MIHDFVDYHRPNLRSGIRAAQGGGNLGDKILLSHAGSVTTERHPILRSTENKAVHVATQVGVSIAGEQINCFPVRSEGKAGGHSRGWIKLGFIENDVTSGLDSRAAWDAKFFWSIEIVR